MHAPLYSVESTGMCMSPTGFGLHNEKIRQPLCLHSVLVAENSSLVLSLDQLNWCYFAGGGNVLQLLAHGTCQGTKGWICRPWRPAPGELKQAAPQSFSSTRQQSPLMRVQTNSYRPQVLRKAILWIHTWTIQNSEAYNQAGGFCSYEVHTEHIPLLSVYCS